MQGAINQLAQLRPIGLADLTPRDRHRAEKRADQATEKDRRRDWNRHPGYEQRHQGCPKGFQVDDCRDDYRMRVAQSELEQQQAGQPDCKYNSKLAIIRGVPKQQDQLAATCCAYSQQRNRHEQSDLGQEHKLRDAQALGCEKGKWLLGRQQERGDNRIDASKLVTYSTIRRWGACISARLYLSHRRIEAACRRTPPWPRQTGFGGIRLSADPCEILRRRRRRCSTIVARFRLQEGNYRSDESVPPRDAPGRRAPVREHGGPADTSG